MSVIKTVFARQILDSRGNPTIEVDVGLENGRDGRSSVPSGASTGTYEAVELRDGDKSIFHGKSVYRAVEFVNGEIADALAGLEASEQKSVDQVMIDLDGTKDKSRLGANSILGVSMAVARAAANSAGVPLWRYIGGDEAHVMPTPMMNILNGGAHADNALDVQEFMIMPMSASSMASAVRIGVEIFHTLKSLLTKAGLSTAVGDEGGFAPAINDTSIALDYILQAIETAGYKAGDDVMIAIDAAATEFFEDGQYHLKGEGKVFSSNEMITYWQDLTSRYPICSVEDPLSEDDWDGYSQMTKQIGDRIQIVGDDLFVTNSERLAVGIKTKAAGAILVKVNQVGTVSETLETIKMAQDAGMGTVISHRSGETEDHFIADLAVATNAGQIKTGSLSRSDRVAKYNQLLRIEESLKKRAVYYGRAFLDGGR